MAEMVQAARRRLAVCLINPKFEPSFWGADYALPLMPGDRRCWVVTGALPALAALAPPHCDVRLLDENVEPIDVAALRQYDVIGVTGMVVQARRMHEILGLLKTLTARIVVGGPYVSVAEAEFIELCDTRFIGEAETTWPAFLTALADGETVADRYEQAEKSDMSLVPPPRYDLLQSARHLMASLQFSRGCPFRCEFCDIITIFGRVPRLKTPAQMLLEFDAIHRAGFRVCFLVDDNFIGNKAKVKPLLAALIGWQRAHGFPLQFIVEASINLAEDVELIELMVAANIRQVFIGIESPREASLLETLKVQNVRKETMLSRLNRIRDGGLVIQAGFIVGFDNDDELIFDEQFDFIQAAGIAQALVAILSPIPTTPLYDRLRAEGRLDAADPEVIFHPRGMPREVLKREYGRLMRRLYEPEAFFGRLFDGLQGSPAFRARRAALERTIRAPGGRWWRKWRGIAGGLLQGAKLGLALRRHRLLRRLGAVYIDIWRRRNLALGQEGVDLFAFVALCALHFHYYQIAQGTAKGNFGTLPKLAAQSRAA